MAKDKNTSSSSGIVYNSLTHGSKIIGKIVADKDFRIDGEIEGDIICNGKIIIGQQGLLKGNIQCTFAEISGRVEGKIDVTDTLSLRENAVVTGEIKTKILIVEPKATFEGTCSMLKNTSIQEVSERTEFTTKKIKQMAS